MKQNTTEPKTKLPVYNALWKAQAWCRRNWGTYYLYENREGEIEIHDHELMGWDVVELWVNGVKKFRDPRYTEPAEKITA